jgi:hypothetical protein
MEDKGSRPAWANTLRDIMSRPNKKKQTKTKKKTKPLRRALKKTP